MINIPGEQQYPLLASFPLEEKINPVDSYDVNLINFVYPLEPVWNRSSQTVSEHTPILNSQPKPKCPLLKENCLVTWSQNIPCLLSRHPSGGKTSPVQYFLPRIKTSLRTMTLQGWMQQHHLVMAALNLLAQDSVPGRSAGAWLLFSSPAGAPRPGSRYGKLIHFVPSSVQGGWALPSASCQAAWFAEPSADDTQLFKRPTEKNEQISWCCAWAAAW